MDTKQFKEYAPVGSSPQDFWRTYSDSVGMSKTLHIHDTIFAGLPFVSATALKASMPIKLRVFQDYFLKQQAESRNSYLNTQYAKCKLDKTRIYKLNQFPIANDPTMVQVLKSRAKVFLSNAIVNQILQDTDFRVTNLNAGIRSTARALFQRHIGYNNITRYSTVDDDAFPPITADDIAEASDTVLIPFDQYEAIFTRNFELKYKAQMLGPTSTLEDIMNRMTTSTVSAVSSM
jgi:hypothetical protein